MFNRINWIAVALSVVALEGFGFLWYGVLMKAPWTAAYVEVFGRGPDLSNVAVMQSLGMVNTLILTLGLAKILPALGKTGFKAIKGAALIWLAFNFTTMAIEYLYMGIGLRLVGINMAYQLIAYLIAGTIMGWLPPVAQTAASEE